MKLSAQECSALRQLAQQAAVSSSASPETAPGLEVVPVAPGEPMNQGASAQRLVLVIEGSGRFLDPDKSFGQYTIECLQAPFLLGGLQLLAGSGAPLAALGETCIAASPCQVVDLGALPLPEGLEQQVRTLLADRICSQEYPLLSRLAAEQAAPVGGPLELEAPRPGLERTIAEWRIVRADTLDLYPLVIHADQPQPGRVYGDRVDPAELRSLPDGEPFPRLLGLQPTLRASQPGGQPLRSARQSAPAAGPLWRHQPPGDRGGPLARAAGWAPAGTAAAWVPLASGQ